MYALGIMDVMIWILTLQNIVRGVSPYKDVVLPV